ncbi:hypothetical protein [Mucilaginibacter boryungensis]|uniref:Uncharacterized protein n=1 Tax=Mucilaginibacter boryungensis TaxID=768480 RepID=A0ABR9XGE7_9SPHI|nr:hypothetical protein [Mucilaginibacter boryungensis]MBE9666452.1 hypothetical protein [Mucilaginibacter boryungensis]
MRNCLFIILSLVSQFVFAQVIYTPVAKSHYDAAVKKIPIQYKAALNELYKQTGNPNGVAIFTFYKTDTLNKEEKIDRGNVHIYLSSPNDTSKKEDITSIKEENTYLPIPCMAIVNGDSLLIEVPPIFNPFVKHVIIKNRVISTYEEYQKRDKIFQLNLSSDKTEKLSIPVRTPVLKLNSSNRNRGQIIYGEVEYITQPYYVDDDNFKSKHICKSIHCKYVFRALL